MVPVISTVGACSTVEHAHCVVVASRVWFPHLAPLRSPLPPMVLIPNVIKFQPRSRNPPAGPRRTKNHKVHTQPNRWRTECWPLRSQFVLMANLAISWPTAAAHIWIQSVWGPIYWLPARQLALSPSPSFCRTSRPPFVALVLPHCAVALPLVPRPRRGSRAPLQSP